MNITKIDSATFQTVESTTTDYTVSDLYAQINTAEQRIAQLILNAQTALLAEIAADQSLITQLNSLISQAGAAGCDITPPTLTDSSALVTSVTSLQSAAQTVLL